MKLGIASYHGGFGLKEELITRLHSAGHEVTDFDAHSVNPGDDYFDFMIPFVEAVVAGKVERGLAIGGSEIGAAVCANKVKGVRVALIHDRFSARKGVEDDHMNILCIGGRTVGRAVSWILCNPASPQSTSRRSAICAASIR